MNIEPTTWNYYPTVFFNEFWLLRDKLIAINDTVNELDFHLEVAPISMTKWQLFMQIDQSFQIHRSYRSMLEGEADEVKVKEECARTYSKTTTSHLNDYQIIDAKVSNWFVGFLPTIDITSMFKKNNRAWREPKQEKRVNRVWFVGYCAAVGELAMRVHHGANVEAVIMKTEVPGQEDAEGNVVERDKVACEVISKWISVMKQDMDTRSSMCILNNGFWRSSDDSNMYYWKYAPGLLDEAKEIILGMEIFMTQSGNTLRVSQFRFSNVMSVQILLGGHSTLSLEGGLSGNHDEEE
ncbi:zinc finger, CCHC-type containing protein [Tanacetum coccineum]|uniref:Zinc finger, CCHC-type containing protein n=1 Tax=Tanacetum coccineum TaxID=301880 RepID=A0ABQ4Y4P1_9ASTR